MVFGFSVLRYRPVGQTRRAGIVEFRVALGVLQTRCAQLQCSKNGSGAVRRCSSCC